MFFYRTHSEIEYLTTISGIPANVIDSWAALNIVTSEELVWQKAQIRVKLRYIRETGQFWDRCGEEHRWSSRWGRTIRSQALNVFVVRERFVSNPYPEVSPYCQRIEVPRGCNVNAP